MNIENAKRAIAVMERVANYDPSQFYMPVWVHSRSGPRPETEEEALQCGTAACFLGWLALAPDIPEIFFDPAGNIRGENHGWYEWALREFLGISHYDAETLCNVAASDDDDFVYLPGTDIYAGSATTQDIITSLQYLISEAQK